MDRPTFHTRADRIAARNKVIRKRFWEMYHQRVGRHYAKVNLIFSELEYEFWISPRMLHLIVFEDYKPKHMSSPTQEGGESPSPEVFSS